MVYDEKLEGYFIEAEYTDKNRITYAYRYGYTTSADGGEVQLEPRADDRVKIDARDPQNCRMEDTTVPMGVGTKPLKISILARLNYQGSLKGAVYIDKDECRLA